MVARRYVLLALALLAIVASGTLGGLALAQFALSGVNPFYWNAPLPGPLVAAPEPGAMIELAPPEPVVLPAAWSTPAADEGADAGFDPGPPDPALDETPPAPPPEPILVTPPKSAPAAISLTAPAPAVPVETAQPDQ